MQLTALQGRTADTSPTRGHPLEPPRPIDILGCAVDPVDASAALDRVRQAIEARDRLLLCAVNTAKLVMRRRNPELRADIEAADLVYADGAGVCLAAWLGGRPLPGRLAGIDLMAAILAQSAREGWRPYLLGARPDVVAEAAVALCRDLPGLQLAGWRDGYFDPGDEADVVEAINRSDADCLFVALPSPMKERFLARNAARLKTPVLMGVGGSLDVLAGRVPRAPGWMRRTGLEWLHRLLCEPRRMAWRYVSTNAAFAVLMLPVVLCRALRRPGAG